MDLESGISGDMFTVARMALATQRAMDKGSKFGRASAEEAWKSAEADALFKLHAAGVSVPKPVLFFEGVLLMELVMAEDGTLEYAAACAVHVWLGPNFPHEPPLVRPISPLFHPNVVPQGINIDRAWTNPGSACSS